MQEMLAGGYDQGQARERLETTLASAQTEKYTNPIYNQNNYLDTLITKELPEANIAEDIVILDGWAFELDRSVPKIKQDLGKEGSYTFPTIISTNVEVSSDKKSATITVVAEETEHGITKMELYKDGNMVGTAIDCGGSKTQVTKTFTVTEGGNYTVKVYSEYSKSVPVNVTGLAELTTDRSSLQVGDYINYTPDTASAYSLTTTVSGYGSKDQSIAQDTTLKWQVMNINTDGSIDLVSSAPIITTVGFGNAIGYNNGVYVLNDLCKTQYSNTTLGTVARSIDLEDIEPKFNSIGITARNDYTSSGSVKYGNSKTFSGSYSYTPDLYNHVGATIEDESKDYYISPTTATYSQKGTLTVTQTGYNLTTLSSYMDDQNFYNLIFSTGTTYWLASRFTDCGKYGAGFSLRQVSNNSICLSNSLFHSSNNSYYGGSGVVSKRVRPVVHLGSNIKISTAGGTADNPRNISL